MWWEDGDDQGVIVNMRGRDENKKHRHIKLLGTEPCFWVLHDAKLPQSPRIKRVEPEPLPGFFGEKLIRITTYLPNDMKDLREWFENTGQPTWQADLRYGRDVRYKCGIKATIEVPEQDVIIPSNIHPTEIKILPRVCVFDIETYDKNGYSSPEEPTAPIVSVAMWDSYTDRYVIIFNGDCSKVERERYEALFAKEGFRVDVYHVVSEEELLTTFVEFLEQVRPDVMVGWNSAGDGSREDGFDVPYLQGRMKRNGIWFDWRSVAQFDLMYGYAKLHKARYGELEEKGLDFVSTQIFKLPGKANDGMKIWQMMEHAPSKLIHYNVFDVFLAKEIMLKSNAIDFWCTVAAMAGIGVDEVLSEMRITDGIMFHMLRDECIQPTSKPKAEASYEGGDVFSRPGIYDNVFEVDNSAEYPSLGRTFNMSPDTFVRPEDYHKYSPDETYNLPTGSRYLKDEDGKHRRGCFPRAWDMEIKIRDEMKKAGMTTEELAIKVVMNSHFGCTKLPYYRLSNARIGGDIMFMGREHLGWNTRIAVEEFGAVNTLRDTDSTHGHFPGKTYEETIAVVGTSKSPGPLVIRLNESFADFVRPYGAKRHFLSVKLEHVYTRQLVGADKMYACVWESAKGDLERDGKRYEMKVRGFALRKSDSAPITRVVQKHVLETILLGGSKDDIESYVATTARHIRDGTIVITDCRLPKGIGRSLESYQVKQEHVRAAEWSNKNLNKRYGEGSKPCFYFGYIEGKPKTDVFALDWNEPIPKEAVIDYGHTIERVLVMPLRTMLKGTGLDPAHVVLGKKQKTMFE